MSAGNKSQPQDVFGGGDVPGNAYRLLELQSGNEGLHVDVIDLVDAQSRTNKNEGWVKCLPVRLRYRHESVLVHVGKIAC